MGRAERRGWREVRGRRVGRGGEERGDWERRGGGEVERIGKERQDILVNIISYVICYIT